MICVPTFFYRCSMQFYLEFEQILCYYTGFTGAVQMKKKLYNDSKSVMHISKKQIHKYHLQLYLETIKGGIDFCTSKKFTNSFLSNYILINHIAFQDTHIDSEIKSIS